MKETVFNILQASVPESRVLDLFAGAGNLGLEAVSRGARRVVFVERNPDALQALRRNLKTLGLAQESPRQAPMPALDLAAGEAPVQETVEVIAGDAIRFLREYTGEPFDLILADPPYDSGMEETFLGVLREEHLVPGGVVVFQHRSDWCLGALPQGLAAERPRKFGETVIDFLQRLEGRREGRDV